jgi:hypothetical protein
VRGRTSFSRANNLRSCGWLVSRHVPRPSIGGCSKVLQSHALAIASCSTQAVVLCCSKLPNASQIEPCIDPYLAFRPGKETISFKASVWQAMMHHSYLKQKCMVNMLILRAGGGGAYPSSSLDHHFSWPSLAHLSIRQT